MVVKNQGCGKTSLLKALAGQLHQVKSANTSLSGQVRYNDKLIQDVKNLANWSSFVGQTDEHMSLLTVRETLDFAWRCRKEAQHNNTEVHSRYVEQYGEQVSWFLLSFIDVISLLSRLHNECGLCPQ